MPDETAGVVEAAAEHPRILGHIRGSRPGPCLIAMAGLHGNEPSGIEAAKLVLDHLERVGTDLRGDLICLAGNLTALRFGHRFVHLDLNRQWTPEKVAALPEPGDPGGDDTVVRVEHGEQRELLEALRAVVAEARGTIHFLDMHTSSADGPPFLTVGDTMRNRRFAQKLPMPLILGLEEQVDGALLEYLNNFGFVTMGVEGGQHEAASSRRCHESVLWLSMEAAGIVDASEVPDIEGHRNRLREMTRGAPPIVEVRHRHVISAANGFCMEPGYANFDSVSKGQLMARDHAGEIFSPEDGRVLLPLYQGQGDDGFFISREVRPFWLKVSAVLRRLRLGRMMRLLPGVSRHPSKPDVLVVDTSVARVYPLEIFHLLGFRKVRQEGTRLMVGRRRYDTVAPERFEL